jgi:hypothetical protein
MLCTKPSDGPGGNLLDLLQQLRDKNSGADTP